MATQLDREKIEVALRQLHEAGAEVLPPGSFPPYEPETRHQRLLMHAGSDESFSCCCLMVLAVAMIPLLVVPLVVELSRGTEQAVLAADYAIWAIFAVEYAAKV